MMNTNNYTIKSQEVLQYAVQLAQGKGTHETFDYTPFSDAGLLSELIKNRIKLDVSYNEKV